MTNTIPNVPRELLERAIHSLAVGMFDGDKQTATELRALLSAPSPAGVDGLEVIGKISVSFDDGDNCAAIELVDLSCLLHEGDTEICRLSDAQAIIDGLRAEVAQFKATISDSESVFVNMMRGTIAKPSLRSMVNLYSGEVLNGEDALQLELAKANAERDQPAQRIGELEGLLRAESARVDFLDAYIVTADAPDTGKVAMLADSGTLRECIDAALSAGKEGE